jgi:hypothetical protein
MEVAILSLQSLFLQLEGNLFEIHDFFDFCAPFGKHFGFNLFLLRKVEVKYLFLLSIDHVFKKFVGCNVLFMEGMIFGDQVNFIICHEFVKISESASTLVLVVFLNAAAFH